MENKGFYRYIYPHHNGYKIIKNNESYGWYDKLTDALYDRDRLEECNWDIEEFVWMLETRNPYEHMPLPDKDLGLKHPLQYIYERIGGGYRVCKTVNSVQMYYGSFKTLDEAIQRRDKLIRNGWKT